MRFLLPFAVLLLAACSGPRQPPLDDLPGLDRDAYANEVEPLVEATCATLDCHGQMDHPLRLYSTLGLRAAADLRGDSITDPEIDENMASFVAIDPNDIANDHVDQNISLLKSLDQNNGGVHHVGGVVFPSTDANGYVCLRGWLAGTTEADDAWVQTCQQALFDATGESFEADAGVPDDGGVPVDLGPPGDMGVTGPTPTWSADVYPLFRARCVGCHGSRGSGSYSIPNVDTGYTNTVGTVDASGAITPVTARYCSTHPRIAPGDPMNSGVYLTLIGSTCGRRMPPGTAFNATQIDLVRRWILGGAPKN